MRTSEVTVVDYRTSNLLSITKALQKVGGEVNLTQDPADIAKAERLVLPGVGAFGAAMRNIDSLGIREALLEFGKSGRPLMGICLGMQLLFNVSHEQGTYYGLALVPGEVVAFPNHSLKVPHMGWNEVERKKESRLLKGVRDGEYAYFVHSYYVTTSDEFVVGSTDYGVMFPSVIEKNNTFGIQFHPEKSQSFGLRILENFLSV